MLGCTERVGGGRRNIRSLFLNRCVTARLQEAFPSKELVKGQYSPVHLIWLGLEVSSARILGSECPNLSVQRALGRQ